MQIKTSAGIAYSQNEAIINKTCVVMIEIKQMVCAVNIPLLHIIRQCDAPADMVAHFCYAHCVILASHKVYVP